MICLRQSVAVNDLLNADDVPFELSKILWILFLNMDFVDMFLI